MLRPVLFAVAVAALVVPTTLPAAAPDLSGNWLLSTIGSGSESAVCILRVESKGGKPSATVVFSPENVETVVTDIRATDTTVAVTVKQTRTLKTAKGDRKSTTEVSFVGVPGKDPKVVLGSTGNERTRTRAKLAATDKKELAQNELTVRTPLPEPMTKIQQLNSKAALAQGAMLREKDAEKRKELQTRFTEAAREFNEKSPALYREVVEKHADSPAALDAALSVLRGVTRPGAAKLAPEDAAKFVKVARDQAAPHGPLFLATTMTPIAEALVNQSGLESVALAAVEPVAKALADDQPAALQAAVLTAYQKALAKTGKDAEAKSLGVRLAKLEEKIDAEYLKTVPPFKPTAFAGRKEQGANQVVMMELFTGAQCPPCVAADAAFDALVKVYKPTDLVLVQYHVHIPGPDPMTNKDTVARWDYYRNLFAEDVRGVPSSMFNGKVLGGGGGGMSAAEGKFDQYTGIINPLLEKTTEVKLVGEAKRTGDKIDIGVEVANAGGDDVKLRLLVVEETVKYAGSNGIRFHHQVVRAMPGGAAGVAVKDKSFKHAASVDLGEVRKNLTKYLDDFVAENPNRPFARPDRPMDMKDVRVIAMVQNDKTGEILQSVQIEVEGGPKAAVDQ
jgi:hypothetical protein